MKAHEHVSDYSPDTVTTNGLQYNKGTYHIDAPCINTLKKAVNVMQKYVLLDFLDAGRIDDHEVKFWDAYLKGSTLTIILLDLVEEKLLSRSYRIGTDMTCNWMIMEIDFFNNDSDQKVIEDYCEKD